MSNDEISAALDGITDPKLKEKIRKALEKGGGAGRRTDEAEILKKYSHVVPGTLAYDEGVNKQSVEIQCQHPQCENTRRVFTSDLFQVKVCLEHKKEQRAAAKAQMKALMADVKAKIASKAPKTEEVEA